MSKSLAYDRSLDPPAPVVPLRVATPRGGSSALVRALVDTGADCTVVPLEVARTLRLPVVDEIQIEGVGGLRSRVRVHAARLGLPGHECLARVVAFGAEPILGRDLLNRLVLRLDGPGLSLRLDAPQRQAPAPREP